MLHLVPAEANLFSAQLRYWRRARGLSQLALSNVANVSSRHVSFLETGRAKPSREMVLRLGRALSVPLRKQDEMLAAAALPREFSTEAPAPALPAAIERAIETMLARHEPYPLVVMNSRFDVLRTNAGAVQVLSRFVADPGVVAAPLNAMRVLFDPRALRPHVVDWASGARALLARLHQEALARPDDAGLRALLEDLMDFPGVPAAWREPDFSVPCEPVFTLRLERGAERAAFLTTLTTFSAPRTVDLEELCIESYFPLDEETERLCAAVTRV